MVVLESLGHDARVMMDAALDARSAPELVAAMAAGSRPRFVLFWGHRPKRPGVVDAWCFSQWWPTTFTAGGEAFPSAEHYMMWRKATLFGDNEKAVAILAAGSPAQAKALGREVSGFDEAVWEDHRWDIVVEGSVAKFQSDPTLTDYLLATKNLLRGQPLRCSHQNLTPALSLVDGFSQELDRKSGGRTQPISRIRYG